MFHQKSYGRHGEWYNHHFPTDTDKENYYDLKRSAGKNTIASWLQQLFYTCIDPLMDRSKPSWLTIGDAYGFDAQYLASAGAEVLATDLNGDFLKVALAQQIITKYAAENAEQLSFDDQSFDYVLCKESYHHFPRPYAALYEMIRVAKQGIVIIEPQDPVSKMPALLFLTNLLSKKSKLLEKVWKNRFSYEPVGNFVYKVSEREFEKFAAGLNLPMVAFKRINPNFYNKDFENIVADPAVGKFRILRLKKKLLDLLVSLKIIPGQVLSAIIFKQMPDENTQRALKDNNYRLLLIPSNPYL
ncbi:class I SAM-dependent methyltransferase [Pedobacter metabolipauper]|uniref:Methyltransferase family protein n=1 Tax=Pedobacter metabolipauper TaxID=425513 RepID=A0A4V3D1N5_9SPHI|nr:class I SAM-dependent methyltransferase [Pedobacter metabolipauper]TDQ11913.1 methyltransferase family protein [Pedobacter metabolipauper]